MAVKIGKVRGTTKEEVLSKKFNIFIPISLGNKWFTKEHLKEYILWALEHTKSDVVILIGDKIHAVNYEVRNRYDEKKAVKKAKEEGNKIKALLKEISRFLENKQKINIITFEEIEYESYRKDKSIVYKEFEENKRFRKKILRIVKKVTKNWKRDFSEREIKTLSKYLLDELPLIAKGIGLKGKRYELHIYPYDTKINKLVDKMQKGEIFQNLYEKLGKPKVAIVQAEII